MSSEKMLPQFGLLFRERTRLRLHGSKCAHFEGKQEC
jgi:hypothetical protein